MDGVGSYLAGGLQAKPRYLLFLLAALCCLLGAGCQKQAVIGADSPTPLRYAVAVSDQGTESSQKVEISVLFDRPILVSDQAAGDFKLLLNGRPLDGKTMAYRVLGSRKDPRTLLIDIVALPTAAVPGEGQFFALYSGDLSIESVNPRGIAGVTDNAGKASAKWQKINCVIPSGLVLKTVWQQKGDLKKHLKAKTIVEIQDIPKIRVISWIQFLKNGSPVRATGSETDADGYANEGSFPSNEGFFPLHDHQFLMMTGEDYAGALASQLQNFFGGTGQYTFSHTGAQVTIEANEINDGELLQLKLYGSDSTGP